MASFRERMEKKYGRLEKGNEPAVRSSVSNNTGNNTAPTASQNVSPAFSGGSFRERMEKKYGKLDNGNQVNESLVNLAEQAVASRAYRPDYNKTPRGVQSPSISNPLVAKALEYNRTHAPEAVSTGVYDPTREVYRPDKAVFNEREQNIINAARAKQYAEDMERSVEQARQDAENNPLLGAAVSTFGNQLGSVLTPAGMAVQKLRGEEIDINKPIYSMTRQAEAAREGTTAGTKRLLGVSDFDENGNQTFGSKAVDFAVGTGLSMVDTIVRASMGNPTLGAAQAGLGAGSQAFIKAKQEGRDDASAIAQGIAEGVAENFFEKFSLGGLAAFKNKPVDSARAFIMNVAKQSFTEGSEEFFTDWANALSDFAINGGDSEWGRIYSEARANGASEMQAVKAALKDTFYQSVLSALGGAISGGILGGGGQFAEANLNFRQGQNLVQNDQQLESEQLRQMAEAIPADREFYTSESGKLNRDAIEQAENTKKYLTELADKVDAGTQLTPTEQGAALTEVQKTIESTSREEISPIDRLKYLAEETISRNEEARYAQRQAIVEATKSNPDRLSEITDRATMLSEAEKTDAVYEGLIRSNEERIAALRREANNEQSGNRNEGRQTGLDGFVAGEGVQGEGSQGRTAQKQRTTEIRTAAKDQRFGQQVKASSIVPSGTDSDVTVLTDEYVSRNKALSAIAADNAKRGIKTTFTVGNVTVNEKGTEFEVRGWISDDGKQIVVRADHDKWTPEQINTHERFHAESKNNSALVDNARKKILSKYSKHEIDAIARIYTEAYGLIGSDADTIFEELCADIYAGIDPFLGALSRYEGEVNEAAREAAASGETVRGPPAELNAVERSRGEAYSTEQFANSMNFDVEFGPEGQFTIVDRITRKPVKRINAEQVKSTAMGTLIQAAVDAGSIDEETAQAQRKMFSDLMNLTLKYDPSSLPAVWEMAGSSLFSSVKSNSDKQYSNTVDYGTICSKTQALIDVLSKTMVEKGRGLTRSEVIEAYNKTAGVGLQVPCPVCYVFSRWMGVPSLLETMRRCQERFGNASEGYAQKYISDMLAEYGDKEGIDKAKTKAKNRMKTLETQLQKANEKNDLPKKKKIREETAELEKKLFDLESFNWVTQVRCKETAENSGKYVLNPDYKSVPNEILLDLRRSGEFAKNYPTSWKFRTTRGAGMGKAIMPYSGATIGDFIKGTKDAYNKKNNPFLNQNAKAAKKAVKAARLRAAAQNLIGGQRFQSTSDYRAEWGIDYLMTFLECQAAGSQVQLYTKVIEAVDFLASAGAECNLSIMPKDNGYITMKNGKKQLVFSDVTGINFDEALKKTRKYDNVQMILVGINNEHIELAMADDRITFIIPWHSSGNSKDTLAQLMSAVGESLDVEENTDYSDFQTDKVIDNSDEMKALRKLRKDILQGKLKGKELTSEQKSMLAGNAFLNDLYTRFYIDESAQEYGIALNSNQTESIFPYEYWDKSLTIKDADQNGRRFQEYCASLGIQPRFSQFADKHGYWKLLIDRKMYNNDGTYHAPKAINVTNVKVSQMPLAVNSSSYMNLNKIDQAVMDTMMALDNVKDDLKPVEDTSASMQTAEEQPSGVQVYAEDTGDAVGTGGRYSVEITDQDLLRRLNNEVSDGKYYKTYKAMIYDKETGNLYPPMATKIKGPDGKYHYNNPSKLKTWQQAVEDLTNVKFKNGKAYYVLKKDNGDTVEAAYNPYEHSSNLVLNDQFESAYKRPNIVTVEGYIPKSEIDNPYHAEYAKDPTGILDWKTGPVAGKLKDNKRMVYLSRYFKPMRIMDNSEVARLWKETLGDSGISVPFNVVTPGLLKELERIGIDIDYAGSPNYQAHQKKSAGQSYSREQADNEYLSAVRRGDTKAAQQMVDEAAKAAGYAVEGYHGTDADFNEFKYGDIGYHIGTKRQAEIRIRDAGMRSTQNNRRNRLMRLYAKIENPLETAFDFGDWHGKNVASLLLETEQFEEGYDENAEEINARLSEIAAMPDSNYTDKVLREYLQELGYDGIAYDNQFEVDDEWKENGYDQSFIAFDSSQLKYAGPVVYDDNGNVIPLSERFNESNKDIRYSRDYAPTFYSKLQREIEGFKGDKIGAASVESYLKGKGVKDEEIKWSGIRQYLEGKKSVSKQELMDYLKANELEIEEIRYDREGIATGDIGRLQEARDAIEQMAADKAQELDLDYEDIEINEDNPVWKAYAVKEDGSRVELATLDTSGTRWSGYKLDGGDNYREILFKVPGSDYSNDAMETHWKQPGVLAHARVQDFNTNDGDKVLFVEEIQSDWHNAGQKYGYGDNQSSSDWYDQRQEAAKKFMQDAAAESLLKKVKKYKQIDSDSDQSALRYLMNEGDGLMANLYAAGYKISVPELALYDRLRKDIDDIDRRSKRVPDAPFRDAYTNYVLKDLLRIAAEEDYDYLAWTTGKMQEERWSDQYAEGYRIEYDQDIPKFLKKYGKQWGASLTEVDLSSAEANNLSEEQAKNLSNLFRIIREYDNNVYYSELVEGAGGLQSYVEDTISESDPNYGPAVDLAEKIDTAYDNDELYAVPSVPAIEITDDMKQSVLYEGQPMFSREQTEYAPASQLSQSASEQRINELENELSKLRSEIDLGLGDTKALRRQEIILQNELDKLHSEERKAAVKTSVSDILENLDKYRRLDLISLGNQLTESTWDELEDPDYPTEDIRQGVREMLEERVKDNPLEAQTRSRGLYVRPASDETGSKFSREAVLSDEKIAELLEKYGALPKGEKAVKDVSVPAKTSDGKNVRRYVRTVLESGVTSDMMDDEIKEKIVKEALSYEPVTDESAAEYAASVLRIGGVERAQKEWDHAHNGVKIDKRDMAVGQELLREYAKRGDVENVVKMVTELAAEGTRMGQNIQAMRMLKKYATQAPAIGLGYIQETVDQMNRDAKEKMGKKYKEMVIDPKLAAEYINAKTSDEIDAALGKIYKDLGSQVQKTPGEEIVDRLRSWRYLSMLGNPRTHVRNLVGNALFVPAVTMKNAIGTAIEKASGSPRTKSLSTTKAARDFAARDAMVMQATLQGNADKSIRQMIMDERDTYSLPVLNKLSKLNGDALEAEDWIFLRYHYRNSLAQYISANGLDPDNMDGKELAKARQYAVREAQKATYRDANRLSTWLNSSSGAGPVIKYLMEGMVPFKKTPANILRRGIEYSPAMLVERMTKGIYDLNHNKITVNEYIDGLASGLTGTAIFGLGMFLASVGAIIGGYRDDDDKKERKLKGLQEYSVKIGNHTYTIDWAAPSSLPLFVGVETMNALREDGNVSMSDLSSAAGRLIDPMINMSMLEGLNNTLDAISYADDKLSAFVMENFYNLLGQYVPTLLGQVARTVDTTQRINYQDANTGLSKNMLYFIEKMQNKIPYLTFSNDPYLNEFGQENVTEHRWIAALQNFVSPGYISEIKDDRVVNEVSRLQEAQDENVLPKKMPKYLGTGDDRMDLTSAQYTQFQRTAGTVAYNIIDNMLDDKRYGKLNADEQADAIKMAYDYAKAVGRMELQPDYKPTGDTKKILDAAQNGKAAYDTILSLSMADKVLENVSADVNKETGKPVANSKKYNSIDEILRQDLSNTEKAEIFETAFPSDGLDAWKARGGKTYDYMMGMKLAGEIAEKEIENKYSYVANAKDYTLDQAVAWLRSDKNRIESKGYKAWNAVSKSDWDYIKHRADLERFTGDGKQDKIVKYIKAQTNDREKQMALWTMAGYKDSTFSKHF